MPLAFGILKELAGREDSKLITGGLLFIAFATSAGGIATPVGTPPNLVAIGMLRDITGVRLTFTAWIALSIIPSLLMFFIIFLVLYFFYFRQHVHTFSFAGETISDNFTRFTRGQKNTLVVFSITALLWILPGIIVPLMGEGSFKTFLQEGLDESVVAITGALLLFVIPVDFKKNEFTIPWIEAVNIDWGTILLFGGGLSLGNMVMKSGLANFLGNKLMLSIHHNEMLLIIISAFISVVVTEMVSNTATANMLIPLVIAVAKTANLNPLYPVIGVTLGASMAFLLPISTPPNSIVYGTGRIQLMDMVKSGLILDCISVVIISLWILLVRAFIY